MLAWVPYHKPPPSILPVNHWIAPSRSNSSRQYRSRSHARPLAPNKKQFSCRTPGRVSSFYCIEPTLTQTTPVQKVVRWKPQIASCSRGSRHPPCLHPRQCLRYYFVRHVCHVIVHVSNHVTFCTPLQEKVTS